jgi:hypothetical protein
MNTKICTKCKIDKPLTDFRADLRRPQGLQSQCKQCQSEKQLEYDKTHRKEACERAKLWKEKNYDKFIENVNTWSSENPEKVRLNKARYKKTAKGKASTARYNHFRRSLDKTTEHTLTTKQWERILENQGNRCNICKRKFSSRLSATRDHIIPVTKGGGLTYENVQALCRRCNSKKNAKLDKTKIVTWLF